MDFLNEPTKYSWPGKASTFVPYSTTALATNFYMWGNNGKKMFLGWSEYVKVHLGSWLGLFIPKIGFGLCQNHRWPTLISHLSFVCVCVCVFGEGNGNPLQCSCLETPMDGGAWQAAVHGVAKSWTRLSDFTFTFHFHALEKEMATHSSVPAWRTPGTREPGGLPSMGSHRVGHDWSDLAAAAACVFF